MNPATLTRTAVAPTIEQTAAKARRRLSSPTASLLTVAVAVVWTLPTFGLLVTSFRQPNDIDSSGWWTALTHPAFTLDNYRAVIQSKSSGQSLSAAIVNSFVITLPAVLIPIGVALLAAYALSWTRFRGRDFLFVCLFALQIVPIQVTLVPLLSLSVKAGLAGTFWPIWLAHATYSLPLAIFLLHNFMSSIPSDLVEAARIDGASHAQIFLRVMLPLMGPAIAAFGIFQFLWVWNDLLVALTFANNPDTNPMTVALANLAGSYGANWYSLSAAAFVSMLVPLAVFLTLQRFFVRGLLAGSVKS